MANTGGLATDTFQPAATQSPQAKISPVRKVISTKSLLTEEPTTRPMLSTPPGNWEWEQGLLIPITIQPASIAGVSIAFANGRKINKPFIIRGAIIQTDNPKAFIYMRGGYCTFPPAALTDIGAGFNVISIWGGGGTSAQSDGFAMCIAGVLLTPLYIPVDEAQSTLWASIESTGAATPTNGTVTFLCDFSRSR